MRTLVALLTVVLLVVTPILEAQEKAGALLQPSGNVTVNGNRVRSESTLFDGDRVQTGVNSAASISSNGVQITQAANTWLIYHPAAVELGCGNAQVSGQLPTKAGQYTVEITKPGRYEIRQHEGKLRVVSINAELRITKGASLWTIPAGATFLQTVVGLCLVGGVNAAVPGSIAAATSAMTTALIPAAASTTEP